MSTPETASTPLPLTPDLLVEIHRIERLKAAYLRCVDTKDYVTLRTLLTDDCTASYGGGSIECEGADAIVEFIERVMADPSVHSAHRCTQPEIDLLSATEATGRWALSDVVIDTRFDITIQGAAFYEDRYLHVDGDWRIAHTGYKRTFEEMYPRASLTGLSLTASWWTTDGRSSLIG